MNSCPVLVSIATLVDHSTAGDARLRPVLASQRTLDAPKHSRGGLVIIPPDPHRRAVAADLIATHGRTAIETP